MIHPIAELRHWWWRKTLRNREVTIISENCWGSFMCQFTGMRYNSPFVGLLVPAPDYIKILRSLREYVEGTLHEIAWEQSRYAENLKRFKKPFPLAVLTPTNGGEPVEIHFRHGISFEEEAAKWYRRAQRVNYDNIIVKLAERNECTPKEIAEFDALDYPSKVCFTVNKYPYPSARQLKVANYRRKGAVYNEWKYCDSVYNFAKEANRLIENRE